MAGTIQEAAERETRELEYLRLTLENARANAQHAIDICDSATWEVNAELALRVRKCADFAARDCKIATDQLKQAVRS